jgi:hypothetical protein
VSAVCSSCGRTIMWGLTLPGRKRMPLDPERHDVDDRAANVGDPPPARGLNR